MSKDWDADVIDTVDRGDVRVKIHAYEGNYTRLFSLSLWKRYVDRNGDVRYSIRAGLPQKDDAIKALREGFARIGQLENAERQIRAQTRTGARD